MTGTELVGDELVAPCPCGGTRRGSASETVDGDRHAWGVWTRCTGCDFETEHCGWGEVEGLLRRALIARFGLTRLRADPDVNRPLRVRLLAVFRRDGATLTGAVIDYHQLTTDGITGTPAEMRLLANRLTAAGGTVTLDPA